MSHLRLKSRKSSNESPPNKSSKLVSSHGEYRRLQFTLLKGHLEHRFHEDKLNAIGYQEMLHGELLPFITEIFQRDDVVVHTATTRKSAFKKIGLLAWPTLSPDPNPIEKLWGILRRKICDQEKPSIENIIGLKKRIKFAWADTQSETLNKLIDIASNRTIEVIKNKDQST